MPRPIPRLGRRPIAALAALAAVAATALSLAVGASQALSQTEESTAAGVAASSPAPRSPDPRIDRLKREAVADIDGRQKMVQEMVDMMFSFGELGFQEVETGRYLTGILRRNGFAVREGVAGVPTGWVATWGSGKPVIALGSDIDGIPQASQKPGVAYRDPLVDGAPGHGEGHNSGQAVIVSAALAVKRIMEREKLPGTIVIWPGVAEELLGAKAYFVRDGLFKDVDVCIFTHVGSNLQVSYGSGGGSGLVSAEFSFLGEAAHAAGLPWRGRSALDAVELMNVGWNYRREHLRLQQRSHYVIRDGGDQPNVVPRTATVWYYFREIDYAHIKELFEIGQQVAQGAAMMTGTKLADVRVLGTAWPRHFSPPIAKAMYENIKVVGLPTWSAADQTLARAVQREVNVPARGLDTALSRLGTGVPESSNYGGPSDDIGDVSWVVPTVTLSYPANIPSLPGHSWPSAIAMATPIAHKGSVAGAKATAMTMLDILTTPALVDSAWAYFRNVQTKSEKYQPLMRAEDRPATYLNAATMERFRPAMRKLYYDPSKYATYLEQLGIKYPTVRGQ
ncbi:MAG TPA: peptidase dimerization domain-containing protein [Gemmatimonadaceae bacterium]|nr:peptidase dimerization domain-containing protein [Gemmatimonadaceae bacterium]